ncbi:transposase [Puniceicoccus vermicola]|uniref:Transposase n=1 Tax=Puniceicoccus vermicola TaxID=388746 RepID=A0A7X1AW25_9BACT|nr:transposase [Puniceicoccus vermicola]MBC2600834.1 transposase [Puniceicoccus vermicola]
MRRKRLVFKDRTTYHHLMSRTVNGEAWFGDREKEQLRKMIHQVAEFSGIRVITYAVMKNHFHLMVEVPGEAEVTDAEIVRRYRALYPKPTPWQPMRAEVLEKILREDPVEAEPLRRSLTRRMHDVSWLMKTLKQRFSLWFNRSRERFGPVWAERYKSVLIEGDLKALRTVAAYIDLNPVRSGIVEDPKDYRFSGYGEALGGSRVAREGLAILDRDLAGYRQTLYGSGAAAKEGKRSFDRKTALRILEKEKGSLPLPDLLRCRVRYFTDGLALGSPEFLEEAASSLNRNRKRKARPHSIHGADFGNLSVLAGLKKNLFQ